MSKKEIETSPNPDGDHAKEYGEFLRELEASGVPIADGLKIQSEGIGLIQPPEVKHTNASLVASVPNAGQIYDKDNKIKGILLDLMARTSFKMHEEVIAFLDWVEWCDDFGVGYDLPMRYVVAINSEEGQSRRQYIDAITYRENKQGGLFGRNDGNQFKLKYKEGELP